MDKLMDGGKKIIIWDGAQFFLESPKAMVMEKISGNSVSFQNLFLFVCFIYFY